MVDNIIKISEPNLMNIAIIFDLNLCPIYQDKYYL